MENQQKIIETAKRLTILSMILFEPFKLTSYVYTIAEFMDVSIPNMISNQFADTFAVQSIWFLISKISIVASFIILIVARNKCKEYAFSRVILKIHLVMEYIGLLLVSSVIFESLSRW